MRLVDRLDSPPAPGLVSLVTGELEHGFVVDEIKLAVFTTADLSGQRSADKAGRKMPARRKNQIDPLELSSGDAVVHSQHGVGRYVEMVQRSVAGSVREYLVIEYAPSRRGQPGDRLYVPMDALDQVTRYVGGENPTLDKMGGADWAKRKGRARKAVREIAAELIKLYAARQATRGHAFSPDTTWQRELEDAFNFVETPDQLAAVEEVKRDMEQIIPMDRLICGDVGYGKTEIAVRAAFKAVQDGKQVAILVPTTLLVQQHHATFADRYAGFPINVAPLSRFQSDSETKATISGLKDGQVDVVVGTHRLLSGEIAFKDLGLVIIDEEQRFGVEHKEQLKRLRTHVDVLAMSATPIPRTLEMAITGIREMSTIMTPPEERHPVLTFAGPYDEAQVTAAIRRELLREGQVFYVHNRVQSIDKTARRISELVPEARVVTAHGQMSEQRLEQVMIDFWERRADVLVCTTIVEAGLDISTANTLLIDRSDLLGLSQLHQLRGRVGRSRERGYAYFLYPPEKPLTETAHDRLTTIAAHSDLGSGMAVAMKDLEIRGAGNLLGGEQSGHIADVGFDLYIRLVGEAVAEFRGHDTEPDPEVRIELPIDAHLPTDYVESERLRLEMYKRLAEVRAEADVKAVEAELHDRYGPPPDRGRESARGGPVPAAGPNVGVDRDRRSGHLHPIRARQPARVAGAAAATALSPQRGQGGRRAHPGAAADDRGDRRSAGEGHRAAGLVLAGDHRHLRPRLSPATVVGSAPMIVEYRRQAQMGWSMRSRNRRTARSARFTAGLAGLAVPALVASGCSGAEPGVVAYVGDTKITQSQLDDAFEGVTATLPDQQIPHAAVADALIQGAIADRIAAVNKIVITDSDRDALLKGSNLAPLHRRPAGEGARLRRRRPGAGGPEDRRRGLPGGPQQGAGDPQSALRRPRPRSEDDRQRPVRLARQAGRSPDSVAAAAAGAVERDPTTRRRHGPASPGMPVGR